MSNLKYCADGEEGIEFVADTEEEVQTWINETSEENGMSPGYYDIVSMTQEALDALPEI